MLITSTRRLPSTLHRRHLMSELMGLYEGNYRLLAALIPDMWRLNGSVVSSVGDGMDLYLEIIEQAPYTTILSLTYRFETEAGEWLDDPAMQLRIYHDAGLAEAVSCRHRPQFHFSHYALPQVKLPLAEWKYELNMFLQKWLCYCLDQGHIFRT